MSQLLSCGGRIWATWCIFHHICLHSAPCTSQCKDDANWILLELFRDMPCLCICNEDQLWLSSRVYGWVLGSILCWWSILSSSEHQKYLTFMEFSPSMHNFKYFKTPQYCMATLLVQDQVMKVLLWNCVESLEFSSSNQIMFAYRSASSTNNSLKTVGWKHWWCHGPSNPASNKSVFM